MDISEYRNIFENEKSHFFYVGNHKIILSLVEKYTKGLDLKILDAGCGTGLLAKKLEQFGEVLAIDSSPEAIKFAKRRGVNARLASVNKLPFKGGSFDLVVSVDVIYHRDVDDQKALGEFFRVLKPAGVLILRVPANKWLNLRHDKHVHTRERYGKGELLEKLKMAGFKIEKISFVNFALLPLAALRYFFERLNKDKEISSGVEHAHPFLNAVLIFILSLEARLITKLNFPFGLGLIAVCRKRVTRSSTPS